MPTPRQTIKQWFSRGKKPLEAQFAAWIDSFWHKTEDRIEITDVNALAQTLNEKADVNHTHTADQITGLPTVNIDDHIDNQSANPVQNQVIAAALDGKSDTNHTHTTSDIDNFRDGVVQIIDEYRPQTDPESGIQEVVYAADAAALEQVAEPSESTLYITEDTGYLYKYRNSTFELIKDNSVICHRGTFNTLTELLKQYTATGTWDVVLVQANNQIATYHFVCSANSTKISQTLTKDQRDGTNANIRTRTGTITTVNDEQAVTWSSWTVRTPIYEESTFSSLLTTAKTIVAAINELWNKFADYLKGIQHVTYAQLKTLRDNSELKPGQWYRITDYVTTVANDAEARSAGHPFDILVMATSASTLGEDALAVKSARDTEVTVEQFWLLSEEEEWDDDKCFVRYPDADGSFDGDDYLAFRHTYIENGVEQYLYAYTKEEDAGVKIYVPVQITTTGGEEVQTNWVTIETATRLDELSEENLQESEDMLQ